MICGDLSRIADNRTTRPITAIAKGRLGRNKSWIVLGDMSDCSLRPDKPGCRRPEESASGRPRIRFPNADEPWGISQSTADCLSSRVPKPNGRLLFTNPKNVPANRSLAYWLSVCRPTPRDRKRWRSGMNIRIGGLHRDSSRRPCLKAWNDTGRLRAAIITSTGPFAA
jgi:hypothetical protein